MSRSSFTSAVRTLDRALAGVVRTVCLALLAAIVVTISASVFSRFVIFNPLNFADALAKYLMQWMALLGVGLAIRSGEHVAVDILVTNLSEARTRIMLVAINVLVSLLFAIIAYFGTLNALSGLNLHDPFVFGISMAIPYFSVTAGAVYALVQSNITLWLRLHDDGRLQTAAAGAPR